MPRPKVTRLLLAPATAATLLSFHLLPTDPLERSQIAGAHTVEIVGDVGATLHIEPNDTPRAGEEVLAWFALTRKGGQTIPLSDCDCELSIYVQPQGDTAALSLTLNAVDAEGYKDIPGARFTFPTVGAYTLAISGSPKQDGDFTPFELDFDITVAAGQSAPTEQVEQPVPAADDAEAGATEVSPETNDSSSALAVNTPEPRDNSRGLSTIILPVFLGLAVVFLIGTAIFQKKNKQKS